jgi:hypothetical protein
VRIGEETKDNEDDDEEMEELEQMMAQLRIGTN